MPSYELHGKGAIVTGGGRNIGRGIAHRLAAEGAAVAVADIDAAAGEAVAAEIQGVGGRAISVPTDVTDRSQVDLMVAQTVGEFGSLDVMVNNSGVLSTCP
ncbi:MAG: SDR family NAD(P)-dependent oxidoreductase, partial [bacterium]|nr:SDR family NAD(P)-dependent oxidoreductase [bacterium]